MQSNDFKILINLLAPLLFIASVIAVILSVIFLTSSRRSKGGNRRRTVIIIGISAILYIVTTLTYAAILKWNTTHEIVARLQGYYLYSDSSRNDIQKRDTANLPHLHLRANLTFSFQLTITHDSIISGRWQNDLETRKLTLTNNIGQILWAPTWDTIGETTILSFNQQGDTIVYKKMK